MIRIWYHFRVAVLDHEICPECGSTEVVQRGFEHWNHRHECHRCGKEVKIE